MAEETLSCSQVEEEENQEMEQRWAATWALLSLLGETVALHLLGQALKAEALWLEGSGEVETDWLSASQQMAQETEGMGEV